MTTTPVIDHAPCLRDWGVIVGDQHHRADVVVVSHGNIVAPEFLELGFADPTGDGQLGAANYLGAVNRALGRHACEVLTVELHPLTADEYETLRLAHLNPEPPPMTNRATRRKRKRRR